MKRGLATSLLGVALLLGAALIGSVALFAFALGLQALVTACLVATVVGARRVVVERSVEEAEIVEGRPITLRFTVRGPGMLPVHAEVRGADGTWQRLESVSSRSCAIDRPGAHLVGPSAVRVRDDLGLFASGHRVAGEPAVVLVLPEPAGGITGLVPPGAEPGGDPEPDGLQPYLPGTPVGRIHWPSVARAGEWQERRLIAAPRGMPLVVVDLSGAPAREAIDWALRAAAGQIRGLARSGGCQVLLPGAQHPIPVENEVEGWPAMHRRLAGLTAALQVGGAASRPDAIHIRAAQAPVLAAAGPRRLPPEVVPLEKASGDGRDALLG
jgi:uncharacterized protein (DUF58 family)